MLTISSDKIKRFLLLALLLCFGANIGGYGVHFILIIYLFFIPHSAKIQYVEVDWTFIFLTLFTLTYSYFSVQYGGGISTYYYYFIIPIVSYVVGKCIISRQDDITMTEAITMPIYGLAIWGVLNILITLAEGELATLAISRQALNIWTNDTIVSSKEASFFYLAACALPPLLLTSKANLAKFVILVFTVVGILQTGTRGLLIVLVASFCFSYIYLARTNQIAPEVKNSKFLGTVLVVIIICVVLSLDLFSIRTQITSSTIYLRMTGQAAHDNVTGLLDDNGRNERYSLFFSQALSHPFGNIDMGDLGSAHNTFLDVYRVGGIIPFVLFTILIYIISKNIIRLWRRNVKASLKRTIFVVVVIWLGMLIVFTTESMVALNINVMSIYFYLAGMVNRLLTRIDLDEYEALEVKCDE